MTGTGDKQRTLERNRAAREALIKLSPLQNQLRELVAARMEREKMTITAAARDAGIGWSEVKRFLNRETAVGSGIRLTGLCAFVDRADLAQQIAQLAEPYTSTRVLGLALYDPAVIELIYDVIDRYHSFSKLRMEIFASVFEVDQNIVHGVLEFHQESCNRLTDGECRGRIHRLLASTDFAERIRKANQVVIDPKGPRALLEALVEQGKKKYGSRPAFALALGEPIGTFSPSKSKLMSDARAKELVELARKHLDTPISTPSKSSEGGEPIGEIAPPLTSATFRFIEAEEPDAIELEFILRRMEQVRAALDRCTQVKDDKIRAKIRRKLERAVEELVLSLKLFTYEYPNRVLPLFDAERQNMQALEGVGSTPSRNPSRRNP